MSYFNIVAQTTEDTVVTEYEPVKARSDSYQSEAALEKEFIRLLCEQGYEYLPIHSETELIANLRQKAPLKRGLTRPQAGISEANRREAAALRPEMAPPQAVTGGFSRSLTFQKTSNAVALLGDGGSTFPFRYQSV